MNNDWNAGESLKITREVPAPSPAQVTPEPPNDREILQVIDERDHWEDVITDLAVLAGCKEEWSNLHQHGDCIAEEIHRLRALAGPQNGQWWAKRPKIICLCGSTRFIEQFAIKTWELELEGHIVLGCTLLPSWYCPVRDHFAESLGVKEQRDNHHLQKIDLADEILVLNIGGYIGESTRREIEYASKAGKTVNYLQPLPAPPTGDAPTEKK